MPARPRRTSVRKDASPRHFASSGSFPQPDVKFKRQKERHLLGRGLEAIGVVGVNLFLSIGALVGICRLLPHQVTQLNRLEEINTEVSALELQVDTLRDKLANSFSTSYSQEITLRQQGFIRQNQVTIKLVEKQKSDLPQNVTAHSE